MYTYTTPTITCTLTGVEFSFHQPDASGIIITKNEPIE